MSATKPELHELMQLRHTAQALGGAARHRVNSQISGLYASVFHGQGMEFEEVREYHEGDDIRNMDWRVTARTGTPHLKIFREERERSVLLCVDVGAHMNFGTRNVFKIVQAARIAALLGWQANNHGDRVGSLLFGRTLEGQAFHRPTRSSKALWQTLKVMTELDQYVANDAHSASHALNRLNRAAHHGSLIFLILDTNHVDAEFDRAVQQLAHRHELVVVPVDDAADYSLPAMGQIRFAGRNGESFVIDSNHTAGRRRFRQLWEQRRNTLLTNASKYGFTVIPVDTSDNINTVLINTFLRRLNRAS